MYSVYKITNLINNKCYIGSSGDVYRRWQEHKNCSIHPNNKKYNYPLYQAFRKYGLDNFYFEILKDNFDTRYEAEEFEKEQIIQHDSYNNGYNQTYETHNALSDELIRQQALEKRSQKCAKVDKNQNIIEIYPSYQEAARQNFGENNANLVKQVCDGKCSSMNGLIFRALDEDNKVIKKEIKSYKGRKTIVAININNPNEKIYFDSISEAAQKLNTDRGSIQKCIQGIKRYSVVKGCILREVDSEGEIIENNILISDKIKEYNKTNPLINGERHTITEWCNIYGITRNSYYSRIKKGMGVIEALTTPKRR